jgi:hypothetical protein
MIYCSRAILSGVTTSRLMHICRKLFAHMNELLSGMSKLDHILLLYNFLSSIRTLAAQVLLTSSGLCLQVLSNDIDLLHPPADLEKRKHKLKRLIPTANSFFMDVKCQGCFNM